MKVPAVEMGAQSMKALSRHGGTEDVAKAPR